MMQDGREYDDSELFSRRLSRLEDAVTVLRAALKDLSYRIKNLASHIKSEDEPCNHIGKLRFDFKGDEGTPEQRVSVRCIGCDMQVVYVSDLSVPDGGFGYAVAHRCRQLLKMF